MELVSGLQDRKSSLYATVELCHPPNLFSVVFAGPENRDSRVYEERGVMLVSSAILAIRSATRAPRYIYKSSLTHNERRPEAGQARMREPPSSPIARSVQTEQGPQAHQQMPRDCTSMQLEFHQDGWDDGMEVGKGGAERVYVDEKEEWAEYTSLWDASGDAMWIEILNKSINKNLKLSPSSMWDQNFVFLVTCRNIQRVPIELSAPGSRTLLQNMNGYGHYHGEHHLSQNQPIERQHQNQDMEVENIQEEGQHDMLVDVSEMNHGGGKRINPDSNDDATSPTPSKKIKLCGGRGGASDALKDAASSSNIISSSTTSNHSSTSQRTHQK
ncbi:unnamed protein product [Trichogramma brassicae]|uniref:Uncharacterized protein n=1 Tax=Trichogramma brassicae TaxID=86971 RepID=A0A6H5IH41_9HYME|nr:unnamed protein product [Trichogramma brassicae]